MESVAYHQTSLASSGSQFRNGYGRKWTLLSDSHHPITSLFSVRAYQPSMNETLDKHNNSQQRIKQASMQHFEALEPRLLQTTYYSRFISPLQPDQMNILEVPG